MWTSQHAAPAAAAARAAERAAQCQRRIADLRERRPVGADDVARAQASLLAAQSSANVAQGRLLLSRARIREGGSAGRVHGRPLLPDSMEGLRRRVHAIGMQEVFVAAFGVGATLSLFDFEAFAHGLAGLPEHEARVVEQAVWELEQF